MGSEAGRPKWGKRPAAQIGLEAEAAEIRPRDPVAEGWKPFLLIGKPAAYGGCRENPAGSPGPRRRMDVLAEAQPESLLL